MNKKSLKQKIKFLLFQISLICLIFSFCHSALATSTLETKDQELENVKEKILGLTHILDRAQTQKQTLQQQLKPIEISIGDIANQLMLTNKKLQNKKDILAKLDQQRQNYQQRLHDQQTLLGQQVRAAYMLGQDQYIKLLLNQNQPQTVNRLLMYYRYLNAARINLINNINQTLTDLANNKNQIEMQSAHYSDFLQQEQQQQAAIKEQYKHRRFVLAALTQQINTKSKKLVQLKEDQTALQNLINKLKQQTVVIIQPKVPFAAVRGKLPWPTHGAITRNFGYPIDSSGTTYKGVLLAAPMGQPIYAVYPGKVVFANWLGGVGLLIIIQHDQNYMSLYGHAHSILVKTGAYVRQGQEIGTVGQSGGSENSGLFFQIRHDGQPVNPHAWCK